MVWVFVCVNVTEIIKETSYGGNGLCAMLLHHLVSLIYCQPLSVPSNNNNYFLLHSEKQFCGKYNNGIPKLVQMMK